MCWRACSWRCRVRDVKERGRVRVCEHAHDRKVQRSVVGGEGLNDLRALRSCDPDGSDRDIDGCEVLSMALVDGAIEALLLAKALRRPGANSDTDVGRDDRRGAPARRGSLLHPLARTRRMV